MNLLGQGPVEVGGGVSRSLPLLEEYRKGVLGDPGLSTAGHQAGLGYGAGTGLAAEEWRREGGRGALALLLLSTLHQGLLLLYSRRS